MKREEGGTFPSLRLVLPPFLSPFKFVSLFALDLSLRVFVLHHVLGILFFWVSLV